MKNTQTKKVGIIGSGNWGSTIGKIVGLNVQKLEDFETTVRMWVLEENIGEEKLSEIINSRHENVKYLPGIPLPDNLVAETEITKCADADYLIFVLPHQFLQSVLQKMKPTVKSTAIGISLIKGIDFADDSGIKLLTDTVEQNLGIPCGVLMGANLADEVSKEMFCEATLAFKDIHIAEDLKRIFKTDYFCISCITDQVTAELCGALKNIVAVGSGVINGLNLGNNTKAAVIRIGFMEMKNFIFQFFNDRNPNVDTFLESCGMADLITTCYGGRNTKIGHHLATTEKSVRELEKELLNGQSAQGPLTAAEVYKMLETHELLDKYPLLVAIHNICQRKLPPNKFIEYLKNHPLHE
ncbi:Glycerol-3-phosphate dehydrogenase [Cichlidogyrus casuarinus]|uniref:Glycerol-3-phosphate dehydrogenase [NAD(+)] n=1 Tax=Cichlidogyrus casuarinus TaxID=1844966 RepID=A0ABD2QFT7_9PLAT